MYMIRERISTFYRPQAACFLPTPANASNRAPRNASYTPAKTRAGRPL
jgi:hypothetical protein